MVFIDTRRIGIIKKKVRKLEDQLDYESRRWATKPPSQTNTARRVQEKRSLTLVVPPFPSPGCGEMWRWTWSGETSTQQRTPNTGWRRNREPKPERGRRTSSSGRPGWDGLLFISQKEQEHWLETTHSPNAGTLTCILSPFYSSLYSYHSKRKAFTYFQVNPQLNTSCRCHTTGNRKQLTLYFKFDRANNFISLVDQIRVRNVRWLCSFISQFKYLIVNHVFACVLLQLFHEDGECWVYDEPLLKRLASRGQWEDYAHPDTHGIRMHKEMHTQQSLHKNSFAKPLLFPALEWLMNEYVHSFAFDCKTTIWKWMKSNGKASRMWREN